jgi:hypothetical protein
VDDDPEALMSLSVDASQPAAISYRWSVRKGRFPL